MHTRLNGEALQRARFAKGLTHHQLARLVHTGGGERILAFEGGVVEPNPRMFLTLAEALKVEPVDLLFLPNGVDLEALRLVSGLSAAEMAQSAHVSLRSYRQWESGDNLPLEEERILSALARKLDVSTSQVVSALQRCPHPQPGEAQCSH